MASTSQVKPPSGPSVHVTEKHLFFYGYELQLPESRLQQWYPSSFVDPVNPDIRFSTAEHYVMYRKALAMSDEETARRIIVAATPLEANKLGRAVKNFDPDSWRQQVERIAEEGNWLKFSQVEECRTALLGTGDKILVEANPVDSNWGIGVRGDEAEGNEEHWGRNLLGKALMAVRRRLREEGSKDDHH